MMLRRIATAITCAFFTLVGLPSFSGLPTKSPQPGPSAVRPQIYGHVRAIARTEVLAAFAAINPFGVGERGQLAPPAEPAVFRAFDPALYRSGRVGEPLSIGEVCDVVQEVAAEYKIPVPLFARLIWQESAFRNEVVSRAGAQGIAQFMPTTALERGLEDPFDPLQALPASADFLRELINDFGNFGLAAAAYNSGPRRVRDWLAGRGRLPRETRDYVWRITGRKAEHWAKTARPQADPMAFAVSDCNVKPIRTTLTSRAKKKR
jgi:soluble lytic murein transglycosylase-like protein